ncbi:MAG: ankyrin repeat protein [Polaribacter sp.]|jgi:ankyrin repeat protein|tara:strand:- start:3609 stop:5486 length:1878 start_codon:yes stop_codon:yes gene_type:complete
MRTINTILLLFFVTTVFAQVQEINESINPEKLEEVVVTGQINPQSISKSIVEVKVISREDIERQAENTLADVLNTTLNLNISPNTSTGKSGVSLFGLDSQYFKVLIDNIPIINEEGVGNNTDLTLINLDDIERIEIVEGAMGVQYGSNAVSGIINIISKKSSRNDWDITAYLQEETVGNEYEWFDKGRHIQSLKVGHNLTEKIYANAVFTRNDFGGFFNDKKGENYDANDGLRGHEWLPKLQQNTKALLSYKEAGLNIFYRFEYLNERIERYDANVDLNENPSTGTTNPSALDEIYLNNRFYHHLNGTGTLFEKIGYNISVSYQEQTKDLERYTYRIRSRQQENIEKGVNPKMTNQEGGNAILYASRGTRNSQNSQETYAFLENLGIAINVVGDNNRNPLHSIAYNNDNLDLFSYFIKKGVDVNLQDDGGDSPFMNAANSNDLKVVQFLSDYVKDVNVKNENGRSALAMAVNKNTPEVVDFLLKKGAEIQVKDKEENSLAYYLLNTFKAENLEEFEAKLKLLQGNGLSMNQTQNGGNTLLHIATQTNNLALLKRLASFSIAINAKNNDGYTALHIAAMKAENDTIIKYLLSLGADKTIKTEFDETVLDLASENELLQNSKLNFLQ